VSATNLKTAAIVTVLVLLAANMTSTASPLVRGGVMFTSALGGLYIATKF